MILAKGTVIDHMECGGCGRELPIKLNANLNAYVRCAKYTGLIKQNGTKQRCFFRIDCGEPGTENLLKQFKETKQEITENVENKNEKNENTRIDGFGRNSPDPRSEAGTVNPAGDTGDDNGTGAGLGSAIREFFS
jgi:hypothetical protein